MSEKTNSNITHTESSFINKRKLQIYAQSWVPNNPKAIIFILHGLGEYSGRYTSIAHFFADNGYGVFALDHEGHGKK